MLPTIRDYILQADHVYHIGWQIYMFSIILKTNRQYFLIEEQMIGL
jgi:hypothetical protein